MKHALRSSVRTAGPRRGGTGAAGADLFWYLFILAMRHALLLYACTFAVRMRAPRKYCTLTARKAKLALLHFFVGLSYGNAFFFDICLALIVILCPEILCELCFLPKFVCFWRKWFI